ncbi:MAG: HzsA-related protein, partial [Planctomycetota bacterium]
MAVTIMATALLVAAEIGASESSVAEGPVACWDFNGTAKDRGGDAKDDLSPQGGKPRFVNADEIPGTLGGAVALGVLSGDAKYLAAKCSPDVQLGPSYTIEAWIHPTQVGEWNRLVLQWGGGPTYAYHFALHNGSVSLCHGQSDGQYIFCDGGAVTTHQLQHIVGVARRNEKDPARSTLTVYLNGRQTGSATFDGTIGRLNDALGIGDSATIPGDGSRFRGYVDEISIFSRALSAEEIKARCSAPDRVEAVRQSELVRARIQQERLQAQLAQRQAAIARLQEFGVEEIVFAQRGHGRDISGHYYANFGYSCGDPDVWFHADDGTKLIKLNVRTGKMVDLVDDPGGSLRDPQVHYDAEKILFCYRKGGTHRYHLYEIGTDGTGLRQLTDGPYDDVEATYLPDGDIVFCSTRCHRWIGCWLAETAILYRCDGNGENMRMLSSGSFTENTPAVLPDGRILYTRWEYVNRDPVSFHHLWTMNPDGTGQMVYYGNMRPGGVFIDARPIPGTNQIALANIPGHGSNEHFGFVAVASGRHGPNHRASIKNISKNTSYRDPYPLSSDAFLVLSGNNEIALMNGQGETELLYTGEGRPLHEPRAIIRRPREQVVSPRADLAKDSAAVFLSDVYSGRNMAGVEPGAIKQLLVMEDLPKPANFHGGGSQPIGHGVTSTIKRILGTVPVEPDGSACFEIPPMRSVYFALLDENGKSIKQMRSFVTLQPGEKLSCVGCHEPREQTPDRRPRTGQMAMGREPSKIAPI